MGICLATNAPKKRQIERLSKKDTVGSTKRLHGFVQFAVSKRNVFVTQRSTTHLGFPRDTT